MPTNMAMLIRSKIGSLAEGPFAVPGVKKLACRDGYRLRVTTGGGCIFWMVMLIAEIGPRGGVYQ